MMKRQQADPIVAEWEVFRALTTSGRSVEVAALADWIVESIGDPVRKAQALIEKFASTLNTGMALTDRQASAGLLTAIANELDRSGNHPRLTGEYHVVSAIFAFEQGSMGTAMTHLVQAERALARMSEMNIAAVDTWHDLAVAYSWIGFHAQAITAMERSQLICEQAKLPAAMSACLEVQVSAAVMEDQRGRSEPCIRRLRAVLEFGRRTQRDLAVMDAAFLRYAAARLAALDEPSDHITAPPVTSDRSLAALEGLAQACDAIADGDPQLALRLLDNPAVATDVLGPAEPYRLRSLAHSAAGDHAAALMAERAGLALSAGTERQLRDRYVDSVGVALDQEQLRRVAAVHADAALTDPLTGLPNRRRLESYVADLAASRAAAVVGLLDLDRFKAVNDTHGHPAGDLVLQQVAAIVARLIRPGDLLARYGGDEFVIVVPRMSVTQAEAFGERISSAIDAHPWHTQVQSTPIGVSIGWTSLEPDGDLMAALWSADRALYERKQARSAATK